MAGSARIIDVLFVTPPRVLLLDVAGPAEVLRKANLLQAEVRYRVRYVGAQQEERSSIGLVVTGLEPLPEQVSEDTFIVISGATSSQLLGEAGDEDDNPAQDRRGEEAIIAWLAHTVTPAHRLVTICSGALLAARAGLLDGYDCTTHHDCITELATMAPGARVRDNRLYVEDRSRLTSAGITAGIDMMLHLVARHAGHACAAAVARYLVVFLRRGGDDPQASPFLEGRNHMHPAIHRAQDAILADPAREWSVASLADIAAASPRNLSRLFNEHTGMSVVDYVNRIRVALARELITDKRLDMESVAERAGFGSTRQLRRAWSRWHDAPPSRMREGCNLGD